MAAFDLTSAKTVADVLAELTKLFAAQKLDSPAVDARLLVGEALKADAAALIRDPGRVVSNGERSVLAGFAQRRLAYEPVSRILGRRGFYGRMFEVTRDTLDPRPETETLIEAALQIVAERNWQKRPIRILDVGTGTGCILITLLAELPLATGVARDISRAALSVAARNAVRLGVADRMELDEGSALDGLTGPFDLVVSNPPYIPTSDMTALDPDVRCYDPLLSLDGGDDGLAIYRAMAQRWAAVVPDGAIVVEVGAGQAAAVAKLFSDAFESPGQVPQTWTDLGGIVRCVAVQTHLTNRA